MAKKKAAPKNPKRVARKGPHKKRATKPNAYKGKKNSLGGNSEIGVEGEPYQWDKGFAPNPNGRPRNVRYVSEHLRDILQSPCADYPMFKEICEDCSFGDPKKVTISKAIAMDLLLKAFGGKPAYTQEMLNRAEGKVKDEVEVSGGSIVDAMQEYLKGKSS
jgi:hypothetical protein